MFQFCVSSPCASNCVTSRNQNRQNCASKIILESLLSTNSTVKVTCQVGLFLLEKKSSWIFSPQKIGFPWAYFHPQNCGQWSLWAPNTQKTGAHAPVIYLDDGMLHYTPFSTLGKRVCRSSCGAVDQENAQAAWLLQCDPEEAPWFHLAETGKKHRLAGGDMCFSTMAWHEGLCFNHW